MTTNERLFIAGLLEQFDHAARLRDKEQMIRILRQVEIPETNAGTIAEGVLADPKRYGF
jgi:hypothetical protein